MIRYALTCDHEHEFEGWFASSTDFDDQQGRGLLDCPMCASKMVRKQIMAPSVAGTKRTLAADLPSPKAQAMMMEAAGRIRAHVEENFDDVGDSFANEARAIHEGRAEDRGIYGQATSKEVRDLVEDGVPVAPLPPEPLKKSEVN
jgi:hypothetical protein